MKLFDLHLQLPVFRCTNCIAAVVEKGTRDTQNERASLMAHGQITSIVSTACGDPCNKVTATNRHCRSHSGLLFSRLECK